MNTHDAPQSLAAERSVIGGLIADPDSIGEVAEILSASEFYSPTHEKLFDFIVGEYRARRIPTVVEIEQFLKTEAGKGDITISAVLDIVEWAPPSRVLTMQHARLVKQAAQRRDLLAYIRQAETAINDGQAPAEIAGRLGSLIGKMSARDGHHFESAADVAARVEKQIEAACAARRNGGNIAPNAIATGFDNFDGRIGGLFRKSLFVVAGRPGMGKSAFGCTLAANVSRAGIGVAFVSAESPTDAVFKRMLSRESGIENRGLHLGGLKDLHVPKVVAAVAELSTRPMFFLDIERQWPAIRAKIENLKLEQPAIGLIVIDYAQLLEVAGRPDRARHLEVGQVSAECKALAMELDVSVMLLAQVNRGVESRPDKRPLLSDLRESGNIEQDADVVAMLYRPAYYGEDSDFPRRCEFIIRKSRDGVTGMIPLHFDDETVSFSDWF